jgi:hypothetical protein
MFMLSRWYVLLPSLFNWLVATICMVYRLPRARYLYQESALLGDTMKETPVLWRLVLDGCFHKKLQLASIQGFN